MALSDFFNPDILIGMGRAHQAKQQNILTQEAERRKQGTGLLKTLFDHPDLTPEARDIVLNKLATASTLEPGKPDPKGLFSLDDILNVRPQVGKSVASTQRVGGQPQGTSPSTGMPLPDFSMDMPAPEAPADYRRSGFYSPEERTRQAEDVTRRQEDIRTRADLARTRGRRQIELDMPDPLPPPKPAEDFTLGPGQSRFNPDGTPKASVPAAASADNSLTETELAMKAANGDVAAKRAWDLIQQAKQSGMNQGEQGTYIPLTDMGGQVIGAWNPKAGNFVPAPQSGLRRGPAPATVNTQLTEYENSVRKLDELAAAYKPEFVGPYQGRYESSKATGILSYLPILRTPEGYGDFMALNADLKNTIIKLITGAQMGVQEAERILRQVPVETDKDENWKSKFTKTQENAKFLLDKIRTRYSVSPPLDGMSPPSPAGGSSMIRVQIPGQPPGQIPASALDQFMRDNPNAQRLQ